MGDAFNQIRVELHTYSEAVSHKKRPKSKAKKTFVFEGTSRHPQILRHGMKPFLESLF